MPLASLLIAAPAFIACAQDGNHCGQARYLPIRRPERGDRSRAGKCSPWLSSARSRLVADAFRAPVLRDQESIGRPAGHSKADAGLDNRPLFPKPMADWAGERTGLHFIPPGQPWRNGYIESFNSRVRDECLNINMFWSLGADARSDHRLEEDYNHRRQRRARLPGRGRGRRWRR